MIKCKQGQCAAFYICLSLCVFAVPAVSQWKDTLTAESICDANIPFFPLYILIEKHLCIASIFDPGLNIY